ncbi:MAG: hydroxyacid dehydrogenase [Firmicutes bacterium HGW-Firmicutes-21]|nr:MAG: hydroxyacid dehydrogenase [Firmicutes bacterium HGW-Firmicutes-21]
MEKIALIMSGGSRNMVINEKSIKRLEQIGEVVINNGGTDKESVKKAIAGATIAVTSWGNEAIDEDILEVCPDLKLVAHAAGSVKPVVSDALWEKGIRVVSSANTLSCGVSETALGFTISASKNFFALNDNLHAGGWAEGKENIRELYDLTIGVVGGGWAGRHYIELMHAFDVDILLYDPFVSEEKAAAMGVKLVSLEELLKQSDIISIHAPSIPETYHMFNKDTLALMKKDAVLINTARGSLIDENALYEHMAAGNLKYACLDVYDPEPPAADNPLRSLKNCIMTPHLAGLANNGLKKIGQHVCEEIERILSGQKPISEVTKVMLATMA